MQVAHYLILTHLSELGDAMPVMDITNMRKRARPQEEEQLVDNPVFKQARMTYDMSQDARQRAGCAPTLLSCILISYTDQLYLILICLLILMLLLLHLY